MADDEAASDSDSLPENKAPEANLVRAVLHGLDLPRLDVLGGYTKATG